MVEHSCRLVIGKAYTQLYTHLTCCSFYLSPRASVTNSELLLHVLHVSIYLLIYLFLENLKQYVSLNYSALGSEVQCGPYKYCKYDWTRSILALMTREIKKHNIMFSKFVLWQITPKATLLRRTTVLWAGRQNGSNAVWLNRRGSVKTFMKESCHSAAILKSLWEHIYEVLFKLHFNINGHTCRIISKVWFKYMP